MIEVECDLDWDKGADADRWQRILPYVARPLDGSAGSGWEGVAEVNMVCSGGSTFAV